jgi:hypothetical protein
MALFGGAAIPGGGVWTVRDDALSLHIKQPETKLRLPAPPGGGARPQTECLGEVFPLESFLRLADRRV